MQFMKCPPRPENIELLDIGDPYDLACSAESSGSTCELVMLRRRRNSYPTRLGKLVRWFIRDP